MAALTPELRRQIEQAGDEPVRIEDPDTHETYVILKAQVYERLRTVFDDSEFDPKETYPLAWQAMKEDWEDPAMDVYDAPETP